MTPADRLEGGKIFDYLRRLARAVRLRFGKPEPPVDPFAPVRQPRSGMPGGRHSAASVEEPREPSKVDLIGRPIHRR